MANLRINFQIVDEDGELVVSDWASFSTDTIDQFGNCSAVDIHIGSALRCAKRDMAEYEATL